MRLNHHAVRGAHPRIVELWSNSARWLTALMAAGGLIACKGSDGASREDAGSVRDASTMADAGFFDGGGKRYWQCTEVEGSCECDNNGTADVSASGGASCSTSNCCQYAVATYGFENCGCATEEWLYTSGLTCEQLLARPCPKGMTCTSIASCPPGAPVIPPSGGDAGPSDASTSDGQVAPGPDSGSTSEAGTADAGVDLGTVQRCLFATGCVEFRNHYEFCFESDKLNCENIYGGTYAAGMCNPALYGPVDVASTSCGDTATYMKK